MRLVDISIKHFTIVTILEEISLGNSFIFANVYGPNQDDTRGQFLEEITSSRGLLNLPWRVGGDFNVVRRLSERKDCSRISSPMQQFSN